ncbi:MAG: hypothetical protein ACM3ZE_07965, partial [Myxococcales bacterium]
MATRASTFKDSTGRYSLQVRETEVAIPEYSQGHRYQRIRVPLPRRYRKHSIFPILPNRNTRCPAPRRRKAGQTPGKLALTAQRTTACKHSGGPRRA